MSDEVDMGAVRRMANYDRLPRRIRDLLKQYPYTVAMTEDQIRQVGVARLEEYMRQKAKREGY